MLLTACFVLVPLLVLFGGELPPLYPALGVFGWILVGTSVVMAALAAGYLLAARRHVSVEHVELRKVGELRSGIVVAWTSSLLMTMFAYLSLGVGVSLAPLGTEPRSLSWPAVATFMLLSAMPLALTTVALVVSRRLFPPPAGRNRR
ncbi:hypothetical protein ADK67_21055 [Saccharothrix sp. NRRL B-16348]|uniref:hypothetical protein n=1 Tax=Saccharothrix sp. NRRL B-16348 TaxID=1415542 RepID=UPI0006ADD188|nr:hypothetical protein [Saccharothrix sp. NRRL B-16348]KOX23157.1 hypothetical protein ADK67_21055 [Saccharothrix sp. NRRL B-16348]